MENKKKILTSEELKKQCEEAKKAYEMLNEQFKKVQQEEEDRRRAQLALEKDKRTKEVEEAYDNYRALLNKYIADYGVFSITRSHSAPFDDFKWWL